jgi:hypothetical protein
MRIGRGNRSVCGQNLSQFYNIYPKSPPPLKSWPGSKPDHRSSISRWSELTNSFANSLTLAFATTLCFKRMSVLLVNILGPRCQQMYRYSTLVYWGLIERLYLCNCQLCLQDPFYELLLSQHIWTQLRHVNLQDQPRRSKTLFRMRCQDLMTQIHYVIVPKWSEFIFCLR